MSNSKIQFLKLQHQCITGPNIPQSVILGHTHTTQSFSQKKLIVLGCHQYTHTKKQQTVKI